MGCYDVKQKHTADDSTTTPFKTSTKFYCCGRVSSRYNSGTACSLLRNGMFLCEKRDGLSIENGHEADEDDQTYSIFKTYHPAIPYSLEIPEHLYVGRCIDIHGRVPENAFRFAINIITKHGDVFFHFNPRFDSHTVVRNSRKKSIWQKEDLACGSPFPFRRRKGFRLCIFIHDEQVLVAVNFLHFCRFKFPEPIENATQLEIIGDIIVHFVHIFNTTFYPVIKRKNRPIVITPLILPLLLPKRPSIKRKINRLTVGNVVEIIGRVKLLPKSFYINLQIGCNIVPHPIIPFHMNLRLCQQGLFQQQMIYNSWNNYMWNEEERSEICPFAPGEHFIVSIECKRDCFSIFVNEHFVHQFPLRFPEFPSIDTLLISGDIIVSKIKFLKQRRI